LRRHEGGKLADLKAANICSSTTTPWYCMIEGISAKTQLQKDNRIHLTTTTTATTAMLKRGKLADPDCGIDGEVDLTGFA
jgi:hypothetical protein